jgi:Terminase small subunit
MAYPKRPKIDTRDECGLEIDERTVLDHYIAGGFNNKSAAVRKVWPELNRQSAGVTFWKLQQKPAARKYLADQMASRVMGKDEALARMSAMARADIAELLDDHGEFDFQKALDLGVTGLIKEITNDPKTGKITVKIHDQKDALIQVLRVHGAFIDKLEISKPLSEMTDDEVLERYEKMKADRVVNALN